MNVLKIAKETYGTLNVAVNCAGETIGWLVADWTLFNTNS